MSEAIDNAEVMLCATTPPPSHIHTHTHSLSLPLSLSLFLSFLFLSFLFLSPAVFISLSTLKPLSDTLPVVRSLSTLSWLCPCRYAVSLAYKESANCRLECSYAQQIQSVDLIPLMVQELYQPRGWLGKAACEEGYCHDRCHVYMHCNSRTWTVSGQGLSWVRGSGMVSSHRLWRPRRRSCVRSTP